MTLATRQALPITMGDVTITPASLQGYNYVSGLPTALQSMLLCATTQWDGVTQAGTVIYAGPSAQRIFVSIGKGWITGARLVLAALDQGGNTVFCLVRVISYNAVTGEFWVENLYQNVFIANFATVWFITSQYPDTILGTPLAIANGGTGGADIRTARAVLNKWRMESGFAVLNDDFIGSPEAQFTKYTGTVRFGLAAYQTPQYIASPDPTNHPGTALLTAIANSAGNISESQIRFPLVLNIENSTAGFMSGLNTFFEAQVYVPVLSTVSDSYILSVGLLSPIGQGFNEVDVSGTSCYFKLKYSSTFNAGAWTTAYYLNGLSSNTSSTGITLAAATWYKIKVAMSGTNVTLSLNGSVVLTLAATANITNAGSLGVSIIKVIGNTPVSAYVDYMYYRQQASR